MRVYLNGKELQPIFLGAESDGKIIDIFVDWIERPPQLVSVIRPAWNSEEEEQRELDISDSERRIHDT